VLVALLIDMNASNKMTAMYRQPFPDSIHPEEIFVHFAMT